MEESVIVCKEVLVVYNERRRPVRFASFDDSLQENKNLLEAVCETFSDILESGKGSSNGIYKRMGCIRGCNW